MILAWRENQSHRVGARVRSSSGRISRTRILSRLSLNARPAAMIAGRGAVGWSDSTRQGLVVRFAHATAAGGFERSRIISRVRGLADEPAFTIASPQLSVVADPPLTPNEPIRRQEIAPPTA